MVAVRKHPVLLHFRPFSALNPKNRYKKRMPEANFGRDRPAAHAKGHNVMGEEAKKL
jgi:hypothetical protein